MKKTKADPQEIVLARVMAAHGVRGLIKCQVYAEDETLIRHARHPKITLKNRHKNDVWLAEAEGVSSKEQADALKGHLVTINRSILPESDDIYYADLIGCDTQDEDGNPTGAVIDVQNFGAGDILEIKPKGGESFYLSYTDDTVPDVDMDARVLTIRLPEVI